MLELLARRATDDAPDAGPRAKKLSENPPLDPRSDHIASLSPRIIRQRSLQSAPGTDLAVANAVAPPALTQRRSLHYLYVLASPSLTVRWPPKAVSSWSARSWPAAKLAPRSPRRSSAKPTPTTKQAAYFVVDATGPTARHASQLTPVAAHDAGSCQLGP